MIDGALGAAGTSAKPPSVSTSWAILACYTKASSRWAAAPRSPASFWAPSRYLIIERQLEKAAWFALGGPVCTFFGLIHAEDLGVGQSPVVAPGYFGVAAMLYCFAKFAHLSPAASDEVASPWRK